MSSRLCIIVPCYNEEECFDSSNVQLIEFLKNLIKKKKISNDSFILYVNDGSSDNTWKLINKSCDNNKYVCGISLAGNVGHQNALMAGIENVVDIIDMSITIDADLQDDINVIEEMIDKYNDGIDIVYGVRNNRDSDTFFKRLTAQGFYKFMNIMGAKSVYNHADFRLLSKRAMVSLCKYKERNLFLRGIVPLIGYKSSYVYYLRKKRNLGTSKYPLFKMISFAIDGITSFSIRPMALICMLGIVIIIVSIIAMLYAIIGYFNGSNVVGWSSLFCSIWFIGGVQLLSVGVIGQYIGKTYIEVKNRPRYNIDKMIFKDK